MSHLNQLRYWQLFAQVVAVFGVAYAFSHDEISWLYVSLAGYFIIGFLGSTVGYHRMLAHGSFTTYKPIYYFLIFCGMCHCNSSPLAAIIVHRNHHKYPDTEKDNHSPVTMGIFKAYFNEWFPIKIQPDIKLAKREFKKPFFKFTHEYYVPILMVYVILLTIIDWHLAVYWFFIPAALLYHAKGLFNVLPHKWGYRNFDLPDNSYNNWFLNIITVGDGWHNNHHKYPGRWDTKVRWWEIDPAAWFISLIRIKE